MSRWLSLPLLAACSLTPTDSTPSTYASFERVIATADACVDPNLFLWAGQRGDRQNVTLYLTDGLAEDACAAAGTITRTYAWNDPGLDLELLLGRRLSINYCTDGIRSGRRVDATATPTSGSVTVTFTPDADATDLSPTGDAQVTIEGVTWRWASGATVTQAEPWTFSANVDMAYPVWDTSGAAVRCLP
jgi:hypothetical protein